MTTPSPAQALNAIETLLLSTQSGASSVDDLLAALIEAELFILLDKDPQSDESAADNVLPLMLNNAQGKPLLAAFTAAERSIAMALEFPQFAFALPVALRKLLPTIRPGVGLVINPGTTLGLEMPAAGVARMLQDSLLN